MITSICRVLQPDKSNLLSFKIQARGSDHKLGHFSQETNTQTPQTNQPKKNQANKQNPKQANPKKAKPNPVNFQTIVDWNKLVSYCWCSIFSQCSGITRPPQLSPPTLKYIRKGLLFRRSIWGCCNDFFCLWDASFLLAQFWRQRLIVGAPLADVQPKQRVPVSGYLGLLADSWQETACETVPVIRILKLIPTAQIYLICLSWNQHYWYLKNGATNSCTNYTKPTPLFNHPFYHY